jgi:hypothetical protein
MASLNRVTQHSTYSCEGTTGLCPPQVYFGGLVAVYTWAAFIALLLAMIFFYSFFVYDAAKLLYMTPKVVQPA